MHDDLVAHSRFAVWLSGPTVEGRHSPNVDPPSVFSHEKLNLFTNQGLNSNIFSHQYPPPEHTIIHSIRLHSLHLCAWLFLQRLDPIS